MFGDKDKKFPVKVMYFVDHNSAVNNFAAELNHLHGAETGMKNAVIRLHGYDTEFADWMNTVYLANDKRLNLFDAKDAAAVWPTLRSRWKADEKAGQESPFTIIAQRS